MEYEVRCSGGAEGWTGAFASFASMADAMQFINAVRLEAGSPITAIITLPGGRVVAEGTFDAITVEQRH